MENVHIVKAAGLIAAALVMGIGSVAPAYGQGMVGAKVCENLGKYPASARDLRISMMIILGFIESSAIYALMISGFILYLTYTIG